MTATRWSRIAAIARRPWVVEAVVFWLVMWEEGLRLRLRTEGARLPVPRALQDAFYYRFGDFSNGYINAFLVDGLTDLVLSRMGNPPATAGAPGRFRSPRIRAIVATTLSGLSVILYEVFSNGLARADWLDIPAGLLGALVYLGTRLTMLGVREQA